MRDIERELEDLNWECTLALSEYLNEQNETTYKRYRELSERYVRLALQVDDGIKDKKR